MRNHTDLTSKNCIIVVVLKNLNHEIVMRKKYAPIGNEQRGYSIPVLF